ncbi:MAG: PepSY domain-containing protein [Acetobacteraceae bacterium]|nr:PepSY domain-containing protein [Acetobacteraceae bacterium]MCX7685959.1 PepSY domain-containing protein [Acetobacteraceae bacterium]MDW8397728.1 PepSY domain-containing protein [Acetobacteraceae bacterium]
MTTLRRRAALAAALVLPASGLARPAAEADRCLGPVAAERAIAIARGVGLMQVTSVECDGGRWEVEGRDADGRKLEVEIDPRSGRVLGIERD